MKLPENVRPIPLFLTKLPPISSYRGATIGSSIFLRPDIFKDLSGESPKPENVGVLIHEQTHVERIRKYNLFLWGIKFWLNPKFRFREEMEATRQHMKYLKKMGEKFDIEKRARALSGPVYLWCVSYDRAKKELEKMWGEI
jgi:hypothetical protein